ncbi:MAG: NAD-dependent succinate-semialdehyde dehydrogenase [Bifidobacterium sp.]|jgi:succinate-semialdehyde dehydrogenase/glutarate-semialdehyde dehydrogenase|nr:NAD-dependent succinate-semialdehyde dehydrogenase [Bifidobacterium sp.]MCH4175178.1 NAD-dependent succinate-semialdehyde dehydrogenase [Bifidobacterium sp.]
MSQYAVTNPATNTVEETFASCTDQEISEALDAAARSYVTWGRNTSKVERADLLANVADIYMDRQEELATIINHEMGKSMEESRAEVEFASAIYQYYAKHGVEFLDDEHIDREAEGSAMLRKMPIGVLMGIMPWNYPYYQVARFAAPNLMLGNTILLKHASMCPKSAKVMGEIFLEAGFPAGAYTNLFASFEQVNTIIADPRVRGVSLTGSERAGVKIAQEAGANLKKVVCELGGNDPFIVLSTDNLDDVIEAAVVGRFENVGQVCNGAKRFIIVDSLYDEFLSKFKDAAAKVTLAPMCSVEAAEHLSAQVHQAIDEGAHLEFGSAENDGAYFEATILTDIPQGASVRYEEFFGPVAQFYKVSSEQEAVELANDTPYGLGSYIFSADCEQALRVADALEAGMTYINEAGADSAELPFGGVKNSGFGREMGPLGITEFVNMKLVTSPKNSAF